VSSVAPVRTTSSIQPPQEVVEELEAGVVQVESRVEVYEADGKRLWLADRLNDPDFARMTDGSVSVSSSSDERRTLDITLDNRDGLLRPNSNNGFWYDKIIKVYRGIRYQGRATTPRVALIEAPSQAAANEMRRIFSSFGFT